MKKILTIFIAFFFGMNVNAQDEVYVDSLTGKVTIIRAPKVAFKFKEAMPTKLVSNQIVVRTYAKRPICSSSAIEVGKCYTLFRVVEAEDTSLIDKLVICQVIERRKSNIFGAEGRLILRPLYIETDSQKIPLVPTDIHRRGKNISNAKFWLSFLIVPIFLPGKGAVIIPKENFVLTIDERKNQCKRF